MAKQIAPGRVGDAAELSAGRALRITWRGLRLRCPNCGGGGILDGWFKLKHRCPTCGLVLDRGESDYFLGAYTVNLIAVELLVTGVLVVVGLATAPDVPWTLLTWGGAALALVVAIGCYPLTKVLWLSFDVILRPVTVEELELGRQDTRVAAPTRKP
ncbi:MAG: DUF983 domain-containing protein [Gemmatimonadaceae bacterium]